MECKKQKYIKKDTNGLKYIKQKKSNIISTNRLGDIFLRKNLLEIKKKSK